MSNHPAEESVRSCCCAPADAAPVSSLSVPPDEAAADAAVQDCAAPVCACRTKHRNEEEYTRLVNRLSRIEGQIRGIKSMLGNDAYCTDILVQVTAVNAALNAFSRELLSQHIRTCVIDDIRAGKEDTVEDLLRTLQKMMK